jgi:hypothetical protein
VDIGGGGTDIMNSKSQPEFPTGDGIGNGTNGSNQRRGKGVIPRQFKLISVNFKEAALDSPTFRASINHLDLQIDNIEQWLTALVRSCSKVPNFLNDIQSFYNSFLEHLVPTFLQDGLIDQEYTVQSLHTTLDGLKRLWGFSLSALTVNSIPIDNLNSVISTQICHYKDLRKRFDQSQAKYERYMFTHMASSKNRDPLMIMEDAYQLYLAKQEYVNISLDLIIELADLSNSLDRLLVRMCTSLWKNKQMSMVDRFDPYFKQACTKVTKIQSWSDSYSIAVEKLKSDMLIARNQVEESTISQMRPSDNLNDYRSSLINSRVLSDIDESSFEKHGYLFMRSWSKASKPIWVRRWVFIKGGVFGMLVLSPSQTFVQETDKIGILLCNVKYYPNEDRRFCFELKTSDLTIIFQAESLPELKSWLKVFDNERNRIIQSSHDNQELLKIASGRYPPIISEFASTVNTAVDKELTNTKVSNSTGQVIMSTNLSAHISKHEKFFQNYIYYQIPLIGPPFMTGTTKTSIIAYSLTKATAIPTALTANIWGSVNWGIYYLHDSLERDGVIKENFEVELPVTTPGQNGDATLNYPEFYPKELVSVDIQMRSLFETAVEPGEFCLVSFRCIWSPNSKQELSGRCFITSTHIYFYMLALGFVALFKDPINLMISVDYSDQGQYDQLKIYSVDGVLKLKLFLDNGRIIKQKLVYLINNRASDNPKPLSTLISDLNKIDEQYKEDVEDELLLSIIKNLYENVSRKEKIVNIMLAYSVNLLALGTTPSITLKGGPGVRFRTDFSDEYSCMGENIYNLPPKAIFHALVGDNSDILRDNMTVVKYQYFVREPWKRTSDGTLKRSFILPTQYSRRKRSVKISQTVDTMYDDEYYSISQTKSQFKFFVGSDFNVEYKVIVTGVSGKRTKVYVYVRRNFTHNLIFNSLNVRLCKYIMFNQGSNFFKLLKKVEQEVGTHGMVAKAIYLYGKVTISELEEKEQEAPIVHLSMKDLLLVVTERITIWCVSKLVRSVVQLVRGAKQFIKNIKLHYLLLGACFMSMMMNVFLLGRSTVSYWTVKHAGNVAYDYVTKEPMLLKRAVYLQDTIDMLTKTQFDAGHKNDSKCFNLFKNQSFVLNYDQLMIWKDIYADKVTKEMANTLKQNMWDIGVKRHDLMIQLKMLNQMETDLGMAEWKNWLMSELKRCELIQSLYFDSIENVSDSLTLWNVLGEGFESIMDYCTDCTEQLKYLNLL